jgi:hypothetical protein
VHRIRSLRLHQRTGHFHAVGGGNVGKSESSRDEQQRTAAAFPQPEADPMQDWSDGLRTIEAFAAIKNAADGKDDDQQTVKLPCRNWALIRALVEHASATDQVLHDLEQEISLRFGKYDDAPKHMSNDLRPLIERAREVLRAKYQR